MCLFSCSGLVRCRGRKRRSGDENADVRWDVRQDLRASLRIWTGSSGGHGQRQERWDTAMQCGFDGSLLDATSVFLNVLVAPRARCCSHVTMECSTPGSTLTVKEGKRYASDASRRGVLTAGTTRSSSGCRARSCWRKATLPRRKRKSSSRKPASKAPQARARTRTSFRAPSTRTAQRSPPSSSKAPRCARPLPRGASSGRVAPRRPSASTSANSHLSPSKSLRYPRPLLSAPTLYTTS